MYNISVKDIIDEDFINYKKPSMFIATTKCTFKCEKEDCRIRCQNSKIAKQPNIIVPINELIIRYKKNTITKAIIFGGLEPIDQFEELYRFIIEFRQSSNDDIIIYTGYTEYEINQLKYNGMSMLEMLINANKSSPDELNVAPLIIKYGRFKSSDDKIYDDILGVELASSNQYAKLYN